MRWTRRDMVPRTESEPIEVSLRARITVKGNRANGRDVRPAKASEAGQRRMLLRQELLGPVPQGFVDSQCVDQV